MVRKSTTPKVKKSGIEQTLVHNLVELQKIHINLLEKMGKVSDQLNELLVIFESAAKKFSQQQPASNEKEQEFIKKVDNLLEQNRTLAKGLTLMEERLRSPNNQEQVEEVHSETKPLPRF